MSSLFLMVTITDRRSTDAFLQLYQQRGVDVNLRTVGSGTAVRETLATLGLEKTEKAVLLAVVTEDTWKAVRTDLRRKMRIDVPGTGIAFTVRQRVGRTPRLAAFIAGEAVRLVLQIRIAGEEKQPERVIRGQHGTLIVREAVLGEITAEVAAHFGLGEVTVEAGLLFVGGLVGVLLIIAVDGARLQHIFAQQIRSAVLNAQHAPDNRLDAAVRILRALPQRDIDIAGFGIVAAQGHICQRTGDHQQRGKK